MSDNPVRNKADKILQGAWQVTLSRGDWTATCTGPSPDSCLDKCLEAYSMYKWPDKDRWGSLN